jgi:TatD DNase family protein
MVAKLIDIGANLTHDSFNDDRSMVVQRAVEAGVTRMIITGSSEQGSRDALRLAESSPGRFYATAGVHPHHASDYSPSVHQTLSELLRAADMTSASESDPMRMSTSIAIQPIAFLPMSRRYCTPSK